MQHYVLSVSMELFEDKGGAFKEKRVRAQHKLDVCQKCFIDKICKSGYKPNFIAEQRNANWVRGSKKIGERYYEPYGVPEFEIKQEVLK